MLAVIVCVTLVVAIFYYKANAPEELEENQYIMQLETYEDIKPTTTTDTISSTTDDTTNDTTVTTTSPTTDGIISSDTSGYLERSKAINGDIVAWLDIPNTNIDFPITHTTDNEYYLSHDVNGNSSSYGVPFLDYRNTGDFSDFNSIIYGHNIRGKRMFSQLLDFQDSNYFSSHSYGYLYLDDVQYTLNFIACLNLNSTSFVYDVVFLTDDEKLDFLNGVKSSALNYRDFTYTSLDNLHLVALSTCSYEFDNARTILLGYFETEPSTPND
jgi:sortase B